LESTKYYISEETFIEFSTKLMQNFVLPFNFSAVDLLKSQEVVAIIGPQTSQEAGFVIDLCNASKVPMVSFLHRAL